MAPELHALTIAADPDRWRALGFTVDPDNTARVGRVRVELVGTEGGKGITAWTFRSYGGGDLDGIRTGTTAQLPPEPGNHDNGVVAIDHVVVMSRDPERTARVLCDHGFDRRRTRHDPRGLRQTFFKSAGVVIELIGPERPEPDAGPAHFYGLAFTVTDIRATAGHLGDCLGRVKPAVQPGREIGTLRKEAGAGVAVAFMSPGRAAA